MREQLVDELDEYLEAVSASPDAEALVHYVVELLETHADDHGIEDVISQLEEAGELEATFSESLEEEMTSNDEFEYTGEEVVSLLERMCAIEWDEEEEEDTSGEDDPDEL